MRLSGWVGEWVSGCILDHAGMFLRRVVKCVDSFFFFFGGGKLKGLERDKRWVTWKW